MQKEKRPKIKNKFKQKKHNKRFLFYSILTLLFLWIALSAGIFSYYFKLPRDFWEKILPLPEGDRVQVLIENGMTARQAARAFEISGALDSGSPEQLAHWMARFGIDKKIRAGHYSVVPSSPWNLARQLRIIKPALLKATIIPGLDIFSLQETLESQDFSTKNLSKFVLDDLNYPVALTKFFGTLPDNENTRLAFLQPETYMLVEKTVNELINVSSSAWWSNWGNFITENNLTSQDIMEAAIVASMVEREVMRESECRTVAGVIHNRLRAGMPLQIDATVVYAWKLRGRKLTRVLNKDLEINSPYNTYRIPGLPPGPICIPGAAAWGAALDPEFNDYYYYVAGKGGWHYFAKTYEEHLKNIKLVRSEK